MRLTRSVSRALRQFVTVVSSLALMAGVMVGFQATAAQAAPVRASVLMAVTTLVGPPSRSLAPILVMVLW